MRINSLKVRNLLSFGPQEQSLDDFRNLNLFIGVNGSGKSNALRLLGDLKLNHIQTGISTPRGFRQGEPTQNALLSAVTIDRKFVTNRMPNNYFKVDSNELIVREYSGDLRIKFLDSKFIISDRSVETADNWQHIIEFKNGSMIEGDVAKLTRHNFMRLVTSDWDDLEFANSLQGQGDMFQENALLIFGLRYIFERDYIVGSGGYFAEHHTRLNDNRKTTNSGPGRFDKNLWADGVLNVAKIILQLTRTSDAALLEEPELGLEPRVIRRFVNFIVWLGTGEAEIFSASESTLKIQEGWEAYVKDIQSSRDEPVRMSKLSSGLQYFISSHSPVILSKVLELGDTARVFEFSNQWQDNSYHEAESNSDDLGIITFTKGRLIEQKSLWSTVRAINSVAHSTMRALGASGADVLQCNGVVWVEGPSDVIYLQAWLDMYARENKLPSLIQGQHFQFQMYGGALLDSLCLQAEDDPSVEQRKLVEMFSFSRNAYVVMDSDAVISAGGEVVDKSNFGAAKQYIKQQFEELTDLGYQLGLWFAEDNIELRTIENYLDDDSLKIAAGLSSKRIAAERRIEQWEHKKMSNFPEAEPEIEKLYKQICTWQPELSIDN